MKLSVDQAITKAKSYKKRGEVLEAQRLLKAVLKSFPKNKRAQKELLTLTRTRGYSVLCIQGRIRKTDKAEPL